MAALSGRQAPQPAPLSGRRPETLPSRAAGHPGGHHRDVPRVAELPGLVAPAVTVPLEVAVEIHVPLPLGGPEDRNLLPWYGGVEVTHDGNVILGPELPEPVAEIAIDVA